MLSVTCYLLLSKVLFTNLKSYGRKNNSSHNEARGIKGKLLKYQGTDYCEFLPQSQAGGGIVDGRGLCIQLTISDLQA